jgi:hypothetical protein
MLFVSKGASGRSTYAFETATGNPAGLPNLPFVVHAGGEKALCGILAAVPTATTRRYTAALAPVGNSQVSGTVEVYATGATHMAVVIVLPSTLLCKSDNCKAHVHAGSGCGGASEYLGHQLNADSATDAWIDKMHYVRTAEDMLTNTFVLNIANGNTAVNGLPFVVHGTDGGVVSCGLLRPQMYADAPVLLAYEAVLAQSNGAVSGAVSVYTMGSTKLSIVFDVEDSPQMAQLGCTASGGCSARVHSGTSCAADAVGGTQRNVDGATDAWAGKMSTFTAVPNALSIYTKTNRLTYTLEIEGNTAVENLPFVVYAGGANVMCGVLRPALSLKRKFVTALAILDPSTTTPETDGAGIVEIYTTGATKLDVQLSLATTLPCKSNTCKAHVHAGTGCSSATWGGHQLNVDGTTDAWTGKMQYKEEATSVNGAVSTYSIAIALGNTAVEGKPFLLHGGGGVISCGLLMPAVYRPYIPGGFVIAGGSGAVALARTDAGAVVAIVVAVIAAIVILLIAAGAATGITLFLLARRRRSAKGDEVPSATAVGMVPIQKAVSAAASMSESLADRKSSVALITNNPLSKAGLAERAARNIDVLAGATERAAGTNGVLPEVGAQSEFAPCKTFPAVLHEERLNIDITVVRNDDGSGSVHVTDVAKGSEAEAAGIASGDVIVSARGKRAMQELVGALKSPERPIELVIARARSAQGESLSAAQQVDGPAVMQAAAEPAAKKAHEVEAPTPTLAALTLLVPPSSPARVSAVEEEVRVEESAVTDAAVDGVEASDSVDLLLSESSSDDLDLSLQESDTGEAEIAPEDSDDSSGELVEL